CPVTTSYEIRKYNQFLLFAKFIFFADTKEGGNTESACGVTKHAKRRFSTPVDYVIRQKNISLCRFCQITNFAGAYASENEK
ncbi:MAG: hypothetical protein D3904_02890, partial [Candidatus Electrothrix sp. EH2]|nr:hypothetical protein [Candidatus Electrothrix sp. EH2]